MTSFWYCLSLPSVRLLNPLCCLYKPETTEALPSTPEHRTPNSTARNTGYLKLSEDSLALYHCTQCSRQKDLDSFQEGPTWTQEGSRWE